MPADTPVILSEHSPELRNEVAELRGQLQALVANLGTRQSDIPAAPQVFMLQPMGMGMGRHDDWQARHDLTHERDDLRKKIQDQELTIAQLEQALAEGQTTLRAESVAKAQAKQQIVALVKTQADLQTQQKKLQEDAELVRTQLVHVQEELERYFLDAQALKQDKEQLQNRVNRLLKRLPGTVEWDDLTVQASNTSLTLTLHQVVSADRQVSRLKLVLVRHKKQPMLRVEDVEGQPPALLHGSMALRINPAAATDSAEATALAQLAPSDIEMLHQVCSSVAPALPAPMDGRDKWTADLNLLAEQLKRLPPVWRYDAVRMHHEKVNPDYEHLWFHFDNATFGSRHWPSFEFRLSAANVRKGKFSLHPKLEFPDPGPGLPKQFENWFEESEDDYGVKYELRFDLRKNAMDMAAWSALSDEDQAQMLSLIRCLPRLMRSIETTGVSLRRPWDDWHLLVSAIQANIKDSIGLELSLNTPFNRTVQ